MSGSVSAGSTKSFTLHWLAQEGEHSYEVKLYRVEDGKESLEDSVSGSVKVAKDPDGIYAWLEVMPDRVDPGDGVVAFITIENTADYAQTWPVELVDNTGFFWWPKYDNTVMHSNYTVYPDGSIKVYAHKVARIMVTDISIYQNTTFYLKVAGFPMASAYVEVSWRAPIVVEGSFCENPHFDYTDGAYWATLSCSIKFKNIASEPIRVEDVSVKSFLIRGAVNDSISGGWSVDNSEFILGPGDVEMVTFKLPLRISTWVPISVAEPTKLVFKNGDCSDVYLVYVFDYKPSRLDHYIHYGGTIHQRVKVTMDAKTIAADYLLSGGMAVLDRDTMISYNLGTVTVFGKSINVRVSIDVWAIIWNTFIKPSILEHT